MFIYTFAIYDLVEGRWVAGLTSESQDRIKAVDEVLGAFSGDVVSYRPGSDDVDAIEARVAALDLPSAEQLAVMVDGFVAIVSLLMRRGAQAEGEERKRRRDAVSVVN